MLNLKLVTLIVGVLLPLIDYTGDKHTTKITGCPLRDPQLCLSDAFCLSFLPKVGRELGGKLPASNICPVASK